MDQTHALERTIQQDLLKQIELEFPELHVHRTPGGVCIEGRVIAASSEQLLTILEGVCAEHGVAHFENHLHVLETPAKG